jgi:hypothetical protein
VTAFSVGEAWPVWLEQLRVRAAHTPGQPGALDGNMTREAVPSWYAGVTFRSKLEADWAATLDAWNIRWDYEPETITLPSGVNYIPDFWLPDVGIWLEVKGTGVPRIEKAIELGKARACQCDGDCTCQWPGGELVLIGHPPTRYNPWADHDPEADHRPAWAVERAAWNHHGHLNWSNTNGRTTWLSRCPDCCRGGWTGGGTLVACRACGSRMAGGRAYQAGDPDLHFIDSSCRVAPAPTTDQPA